MKYRPTSEDKRIIRDCAQRSAGHKRVSMRIGERHNTDTDRPRNTNIAMVSDHPDWNDTDLWEHHDYREFTKGVELTADGRGIFDFYVYSLGYHGELETNVVAYFENSKLVRVEGTCDGIMWKAK
jgi:hypothetical protein